MINTDQKRPPLRAARPLTRSALFMVLGIAVACGRTGGDGRPLPQRAGGSWKYPVQLGDHRSKIHELLGAPTRATEELEEYPGSGITAWFDAEGRVAKFNFTGSAGAPEMYPIAPLASIPSEREVVFGLTTRLDEAAFRRILGAPAKESVAGDLRCVWRRDGYVVDASFLRSRGRGLDGKTYEKGTLLWFEVSHGL